MSYLEKLSQTDWTQHRMLPVDDEREPIMIHSWKVNLRLSELYKLTEKVELIASQFKGKVDQEIIGQIAMNCWRYLKANEEELWWWDTLFYRCNKIYFDFFPELGVNVSVRCQGGEVEIPRKSFNFLANESEYVKTHLRNGREIDLQKFGISSKTLKRIIDTLSYRYKDSRDLTPQEIFDLLNGVTCLGIEHLDHRFAYDLVYSCMDKEEGKFPDKIRQAIVQLKKFDEKILDRELVVDSFAAIIGAYYFNRYKYSNCDEILKEVPLKTFSIGRQFDENSRVSFGPEMPNLGVCPTVEMLVIDGWRVTKEGLTKLLPLENLQKLSFRHCDISEDALEVLPQFKMLKELTFYVPMSKGSESHEFFSEDFFKLLGRCDNLTKLEFFRGGEIQDDWFQHLSGLRLESLWINRISRFTGKGLSFLNSDRLQDLRIVCCWGFEKEGVEHIKRFQSLSSLSFYIYFGGKERKYEVDQKLVEILPDLKLKRLEIRHRLRAVPVYQVYMQLPRGLEELKYSPVNDCPKKGVLWWDSPISAFERGSQLKKWEPGGVITPLEIQKVLDEFSTRDYMKDRIIRISAVIKRLFLTFFEEKGSDGTF